MCTAALRTVLDTLEAEGAMDGMEEAARMKAETGIEAGLAARGAILAKALAELAEVELLAEMPPPPPRPGGCLFQRKTMRIIQAYNEKCQLMTLPVFAAPWGQACAWVPTHPCLSTPPLSERQGSGREEVERVAAGGRVDRRGGKAPCAGARGCIGSNHPTVHEAQGGGCTWFRRVHSYSTEIPRGGEGGHQWPSDLRARSKLLEKGASSQPT
eukprot:4776283-Pleurochrysis_carterae.AAC.3